MLSKVYRYSGECENQHTWISSPTVSTSLPFTTCQCCGLKIINYQRDELIDSLHFNIEEAKYLGINGKLTQERRYYVAISNSMYVVLARTNSNMKFDDAIKLIESIKDISKDKLLKLLKTKNWSCYMY